MKIFNSKRRNRGMTLLEAVLVVFSLVVLVILLWPALRPRHVRYLNCGNNLKQMGLAFRIWQWDNDGKFPMAVSVTNGGAMEFVLGGNAMPVFQVMSNELSTPKILVCPGDKFRTPATNFTPLTASNLSYFVGLDARTNDSQMVLSGDDNLKIRGIAVKSGLLEISSNLPTWSAGRHKTFATLLFADDRVEMVNNSVPASAFRSTNSAAARFAIP